jgi:uncharacterized protein VirK/YbjX
MMSSEERIAAYYAERHKALEAIREIDKGMRLYKAVGNEDLRDVTDELRAEYQRRADLMERLANDV